MPISTEPHEPLAAGTNTRLLIKIPTRERGFDWIDSYLNNITNPQTKILLTLDDDDEKSRELGDNPIANVIIKRGPSKGKIEAINRDINDHIDDFDVLVIGSDDMIPQVKGFDQIILNDMNKHYPDGDGCLWYDTEDQDMAPHIPGPRGSEAFLEKGICMLPLMGKTYYRRFNYVYHPSYKSFWCDNEQTQIARSLKKITYIKNRILEHFHPAWLGTELDNLYTINYANFAIDRANFNRRQRWGFPP